MVLVYDYGKSTRHEDEFIFLLLSVLTFDREVTSMWVRADEGKITNSESTYRKLSRVAGVSAKFSSSW